MWRGSQRLEGTKIKKQSMYTVDLPPTQVTVANNVIVLAATVAGWGVDPIYAIGFIINLYM